jgi:hypothetical protein
MSLYHFNTQALFKISIDGVNPGPTYVCPFQMAMQPISQCMKRHAQFSFLQSAMLALKEKSLLFMNDQVNVILVEVFKGLNAYANLVATSGPASPKSSHLGSISV